MRGGDDPAAPLVQAGEAAETRSGESALERLCRAASEGTVDLSIQVKGNAPQGEVIDVTPQTPELET